MRKIILTGIAVLALTLTMTACVGASNASSGTNLNISLTEFKFEPSSWSVPAGATVSVNLKNIGTVAHTWTVMKTPISGSYTSADQSDILFNSGVVNPGQTKTVTFTAPSKAGTYQVICTQPGHFEAGMVGQLTVK
jgi:uncharacterized cupredoxin-like copper-binding protein